MKNGKIKNSIVSFRNYKLISYFTCATHHSTARHLSC